MFVMTLPEELYFQFRLVVRNLNWLQGKVTSVPQDMNTRINCNQICTRLDWDIGVSRVCKYRLLLGGNLLVSPE